jgi:glycosyltransferase involved in cell wall biosynthesis
MRIGAAWTSCSNAYYRAIDPLKALAERGHQIFFPRTEEGKPYLPWLANCDVVHVYRRCDVETTRLIKQLVRDGTPITYDNDDDITAVPKGAELYKETGGVQGQLGFAASVKMARIARCFTTTSEVLAEKYRRAGVERVEVIGNYLAQGALRPRSRHDGVVIGWIAGGEHRADAQHLKIADVLRRLVEKHEDVRVECIGVNLGLPERYRHDRLVQFEDLPARIAGFDIGLAPLADLPFNRARSDIKLKEYAASGVPWLASPVGPYIGLGEAEGGRLVSDGDWFEALDRLVTQPREREQLGLAAQVWARRQTIDSAAGRWERVFAEAAGARSGAVHAPRSGPRVRVRLRRT